MSFGSIGEEDRELSSMDSTSPPNTLPLGYDIKPGFHFISFVKTKIQRASHSAVDDFQGPPHFTSSQIKKQNTTEVYLQLLKITFRKNAN